MKDGTIAKLDPQTGKGLIESSSSSFVVYLDDIEDDDAKFEGARVEFDIARGDEEDRAVHVVLREGTRHHANQRRFGDTG